MSAEITYAGAYTLFHTKNPFLWFPAAILGHQALEMYLKAALIRQGHTVAPQDVWGHDLPKLAEQLAASVTTFPLEMIEELRVFNNYFDELRYPKELDNVEGLGEFEAVLLDKLVNKLKAYAEG